MTQRIAEASPRSLARMAGVFQGLEGTTGAFGQVFDERWNEQAGAAAAVSIRT